MKVGDLVWVAKRPSCGCGHAVGMIFTISRIDNPQWPICVHCRSPRPTEPAAKGLPDGTGVELSRLKLIPPVGELNKLIKEQELETVR